MSCFDIGVLFFGNTPPKLERTWKLKKRSIRLAISDNRTFVHIVRIDVKERTEVSECVED